MDWKFFSQDDNTDSVDEMILISGDVYKGKYLSEDNYFIYFQPTGWLIEQGVEKNKISTVILYDGTIIFNRYGIVNFASNNISFRPPWSYSEPKDPFKSGMLSVIVPSGGHFYNEDYSKGIKYLVGVPLLYLAGSLILSNNLDKDNEDGVKAGRFVQLTALFFHFYNVYDAIISSNKINLEYYQKYKENEQNKIEAKKAN